MKSSLVIPQLQPSPWPSPNGRGNGATLAATTQNKGPNHLSFSRRWFGPSSLWMFSLSADKHLLVSVTAVNWTWCGRHQHFQAPSETGQNRCQLARRFDHFRLYEFGCGSHTFVRRVDGAADKLDFRARHVSGF